MDCVVAVDVGGTTVKGAVVDADGQRRHTASALTPADGQAAIALTLNLAHSLCSAALADGRTVVGAGVVVPGVVDPVRGTAVYAANLGWRDVPLTALLTERLGMPAALEHDVTAGGLAHLRFADHADDDTVVVQVGTGIAAVVLAAGVVVRGHTGLAGELGHIPVYPGGELCVCGQRGCLERYASAAAVARRYAQTGGDPELTSADIAGRLDHDPIAARVWAEAVEALALVLTTVTMLLDPATIVLSGGMSAAGRTLLDPLTDALTSLLAWRTAPAVVTSEFGGEVGIAGASLIAWRAAGRAADARWAR